MTTKKQHYYPRCLLKRFAKENKKVHVYIRPSHKEQVMSYENICAKNYTYESDEAIDNVLENKLSYYESKIEPIVDYILKNIDSNTLKISKQQQQFLFEYIWLQYLRTDAGRINFILLNENIFSYEPRSKPIELKEIEENKEKIKKFNWIFKQGDNLEKLLKQFRQPITMKFHIATSDRNLLTSDNPVIGTDNWARIMIPISPNVCIVFQEDSLSSTKKLKIKLDSEKIQYLNKATINTASYYVISQKPFNITESMYIYNRFKNENWKIGKPHSPL
ncbi:DUF4238 domain-containing protein [Staphylococcus caeli]|uniref:DUF4238 domain-containing protein n=1 Tax=Staphylococcus caeli TaxID=2201815 RepID=UPI003F5509DB